MVGCLRYSVGYEKPQERDDHIRSHNRPFKCPARGCFYGEVGFGNNRSLDKHISLCHTDPASSRFIFPRLSKPSLPTTDERLRFRRAIRNENLDLIRDLLNTNSSLRDRVTEEGYTALQYAASYGKVASALHFLRSGSNIGDVNKHGSALNLACFSAQTEMVRFLLSNSRCAEDVNSKDKWGNTPLLATLKSRHDRGSTTIRVDILRLLLEDGRVTVNSENNVGWTALSCAASSGAVEVVRALLDHDGPGIEIDAKDNKGRTALSWAASTGVAGVVRALLDHGGPGIEINAKDNEGRTALSWAASTGTPEVVRTLLDHDRPGIEVDAKDNKGRTALSWAAGRGAAEVVRALLDHDGPGIEINAKDDEGRTALSWAASRGAAAVVKVFLQHGRGVDVNAKDAGGRTPLSWAAGAAGQSWLLGMAPTVKELLDHDGTDADARDNEGRTPLSRAAGEGDLGVVELLLRRGSGVDVNAKDFRGRTPLSWAASWGFKEQPPLARARARVELAAVQVVKVLLKHDGIDVESRDDEGRTPLSWAASGGAFAVVDAFLGHGVGVDVNAKDNRGRRPLEWAAAREKPLEIAPVVQALVERGGVGGTL